MNTTPTKTFAEALKKWHEAAQKIIDDYDITNNYTSLEREVLVLDESTKYVRVWKCRESEAKAGRRGSAYAFIAKVDNTTNALGNVKAGDVMKPASWKTPAKHARGNILDEFNGMSMIGPYGPAYLK